MSGSAWLRWVRTWWAGPPEDLAATIQQETALWGGLVRKLGIAVE
jgi:hypothetical protein